MQAKNFKWFEVRRGYRQSLPFLIVSGVMIIIGLGLIIAGIAGPGIAVSAMGAVFLLLILPQASALGRKYGIGEEGILLGRLSSEWLITFGELESAAILGGRDSKDFLEDMMSASVESERNLDISGWYRSNKKAGEVTVWMSVPMTGTEIRRGGPVNITDYTVNPGGGLILLRLREGRRFLISPLDLNAFYTELLRRGVPGVPAAEGEGGSIQNVDTQGAGRRTGRTIRTVSRISFLIILALVGYFFIYPAFKTRQGDDGRAQSESESSGAEQQGLPDLIAGWADDNTFVFAVDRIVLPEMERQGSVSALIYSDYAAPMLMRLLEADGELPEGSAADEELSAYLSDFMKLHTILKFVYVETNPDGTELNVYTVEAVDLKNFIAALLLNHKRAEQDG